MLVRVTPLYSGPSWGTLLTIQDKVTILIDCGWTTSLDPAYVSKFLKHLPNLDLILLSHTSFNHVGALPYIYKSFHDDLAHQGVASMKENSLCATANVDRSSWNIPIVCTDPVYRLGRISIYDVFENRVLYSGLNIFDLKDVDECFNKCVRLRFLQSYNFFCAGLEIIVRPYEAGHSIGGTIWNFNVCGREIVYGIQHNATPQWLLKGAQFSSFLGSALFITDVYDRPFGTTHWKIPGIRAVIREAARTLHNGGSVLIPVDPDGVFFELIAHFEAFWRNSNNGMSGFPIVFLCPIADTVILTIKTLIEWLNPEIRRTFCENRFNPFDSLKHVHLAHSKDEFQMHNRIPHVIFATPGSLDLGFSRDIFEEFAPQQKNLILFPILPSRDTFAYSLWSMQHQWETKAWADGGPRICQQIQFTKYSREPLHPDELYQIYLETRTKQQEKLNVLDIENDSAVTALSDEALPICNDGADAISSRESMRSFANVHDDEILSDKNALYNDSYLDEVLPLSFRKFPLGFLQPAFSNRTSFPAYSEGSKGVLEDKDYYRLSEKELCGETTPIQLEGSKYGKIVQFSEKSAWKMQPEVSEVIQEAAQKRSHSILKSGDISCGEAAHILVPRSTAGHYLFQVLFSGMPYKRRRRLIELQQLHFLGHSNTLSDASFDKEEEVFLPSYKAVDEKDDCYDATSECSSDKESTVPAWRRDLKSILGTEPFRYKLEDIKLSLNCRIRMCIGLENITGLDLLRQVFLDIAPRRICLLPSCSFYTSGMLASFLLTSRVPIKEVYNFWRYKKECADGSYHTDIEKHRLIHLVKSVEIKIPSTELFVKLDDRSWKELIRVSMDTSEKYFCITDNPFPLVAPVNAMIKRTGRTTKTKGIDTTCEFSDIGKNEDEETGNKITYTGSNGFWSPTYRKPEFNMALSSVSKSLAESISYISEDKSENVVSDDSYSHEKFQSALRNKVDQQEPLLLGNISMRNAMEELIKKLPNQVVYAPQGGILTVSNRVAIVQQCSKERTTWQVEGTLDPAYYKVRKCLLSQLTPL